MFYFQLCVCEMILEQEGVYGGDVTDHFTQYDLIFSHLINFFVKKGNLTNNIMSFFHFGCMSFDVKELYVITLCVKAILPNSAKDVHVQLIKLNTLKKISTFLLVE